MKISNASYDPALMLLNPLFAHSLPPMGKLLLLSALLLCSVKFSYSQKALALENPYRAKRVFFYPGDYLVFKTQDGNAKYEGHIEAVLDSVIVLVKIIQMSNEGDATNNVIRDYVPISEIKYLYGSASKSYWQYFRRMVGVTGTIAGAYLLGTATFNHYYLDAPVDENAVIFASALMGTGIIFNLIGKDRRKLGKRWRLRSMEVW